ncbi:hypothetical protein PFISCL1PPCAC_10775, partial [Pristionchus fissidentatus]
SQMRDLLIRVFQSAVSAVNPLECVRKSLRVTSSSLCVDGSTSRLIPIDQSTPLYLISFGKAAAAMTQGAEEILGSRMKEGIVIVPKVEEGSKNLRSTVYEAGRSNLPDRRSIEATKEVLRMVECADSNAIFVVLISGGGSALLALPSKGITLDHKLTTIRTLVSRGASIQQLNAVRRALSRVKGGRLMEAIGERKSISLVLSDIVGDPLEFIASGPTVSPQSSIRAATVINELSVRSSLPKEVIDAIDSEKSSPLSAHHTALHSIVCNNTIALEGAKITLEEVGFKSTITTCTQVGDADEFGRKIADTVIGMEKGEKTALLFGGETTVNLPPHNGIGGRNQHAALAALIQLWKRREEWKNKGVNFALLFAGTDGQDGPTDASGATVTSQIIIDLPIDEMEKAEKALKEANSYNFWKEFRGGICHFQPGFTGTNVMDITVLIHESM